MRLLYSEAIIPDEAARQAHTCNRYSARVNQDCLASEKWELAGPVISDGQVHVQEKAHCSQASLMPLPAWLSSLEADLDEGVVGGVDREKWMEHQNHSGNCLYISSGSRRRDQPGRPVVLEIRSQSHWVSRNSLLSFLIFFIKICILRNKACLLSLILKVSEIYH